MDIIPAIDLINGKCVRLTQGDYAQKKSYDKDPLDVALTFEDHGLDRLHLVDLDGARRGKVTHWKVLEKLASHTELIIDFGGGLQNDEDLQITFNSGAKMAAVGSIAVKNPTLFSTWLHRYGSEKILLGTDVKNEKIAIHGWKETSEYNLWYFLEQQIASGVKQTFCTDISKDGLLSGPATSLYEEIIKSFPGLKLIASGGLSCLEELDALQKIGCHGVIIGKALYEQKISLTELSTWREKHRPPPTNLPPAHPS
ncbi:MAG: 1-(5-phosphoribosyl)-5-[(5-phosphoribosylamino)methylideneamino]imidazole-4-carboxamide isomerase [Flavobacteriales bacterium AspAUS03]